MEPNAARNRKQGCRTGASTVALPSSRKAADAEGEKGTSSSPCDRWAIGTMRRFARFR
jgi:hypothetical protein